MTRVDGNTNPCPYCDGSGFANNVHENEVILSYLSSMLADLATDKRKEEVLDNYACKLTAYMNGKIMGVMEAHGVQKVIVRKYDPRETPEENLEELKKLIKENG